MSKILIILSLFLTSVCFRFAFSQSIEIKKLSETINSEESEFNFFQTDEKTAYYTKSTLGENGYQSLIYKTNFWSSKESLSGLGSEQKNTINIKNVYTKKLNN